MTRRSFLVAIGGLVAVVVVATVAYLETSDAGPVPTTTTTTTTSTTTTTTTSTTTTTTLPPTTLPPTTLPPPERSTVAVVVSSGSTEGFRVRPTAAVLAEVGWTNIRDLNGSIPLPATTIYYADGFRGSAEQLALDASLPISSIAPFADAPPVAGLGDAQLLFYLGP